MSIAKDYFHKAGGFELIKQYWRAGVLYTAIIQFLLLGRSRKSLELLRLIVSLKVQNRLERKYASNLHIDDSFDDKDKCASKIVWIFWWQGMEKAPLIVQRCYKSVKDNLADWEIRLVTENNYRQFVTFPDYILEKFEKGVIPMAHFSDLLRLELLIQYGGLWLDSTVLCTNGDIPRSLLNADLFAYQTQKPGADGHATLMSNWLIYAKSNNKILKLTLQLLYEYWRKNNNLVDYFIFHHFFSIVCNKYPDEAKKIPPFCNSVPHILLLHLFDEYNEQYWEDLKRMTSFHKLSYKLDEEKLKMKGTYYDRIINGNYEKK